MLTLISSGPKITSLLQQIGSNFIQSIYNGISSEQTLELSRLKFIKNPT